MQFLISGGPTYEFLDDVRYLGNLSSGEMGIRVAEAARDAGHRPTLVLGPSHWPDPEGVIVRRVVSALEMLQTLRTEVETADAVVMTAAVADYRPKVRVSGKIKKGPDELRLELVKNPDVLAEIGRMPGRRIVVGFALEAVAADLALANAREKMVRKGCDVIVLNHPGSLGGSRCEDVVLIHRDGRLDKLGSPGKRELAEVLVRLCEGRS